MGAIASQALQTSDKNLIDDGFIFTQEFLTIGCERETKQILVAIKLRIGCNPVRAKLNRSKSI